MEEEKNKRGRKKSRDKKGKLIECHPDLVEYLDAMRDPIKDFTWGVLDKNISYYELTGILAQKIKAKKI